MARMGKDFYRMYSMLYAWYGPTRAKQEITAYCPDPVKASDAAEKIMEKALGKAVMLSIKLQENWEEIAGRQIAKVANPVNIERKIAYVQVKHSAWLRELNGPVKKKLIEKANLILGENTIRDIKFVPGGR